MFTRILVPLDGSRLAEQVLPYAHLLGSRLSVPVHLLRVVEDVPEEWAESHQHKGYLDKLIDTASSEAEAYLAQLELSLKDPSLTLTGSVERGPVSEAIVQQAEHDAGTLVAMSTHGRSGLGRWVLGSVADKVLHSVTNPMLIIRPQEEGDVPAQARIDEVVVPVDGSGLAAEAVPVAIEIAMAMRATLTLLRVVPVPVYAYATEGLPVPGPEVADIRRNAEASAQRYIARLADSVSAKGVERVRPMVTMGTPNKTILEYAQTAPNHLVVMTTHGRSGAGRAIMGSVADRVVRHSNGPVLVLR